MPKALKFHAADKLRPSQIIGGFLMATPALPVAAAAAAGLVLGRWLEQQEGSALPALGAAVAVPSRAAGRVAATGMRMTAAAVILAGGAVASAGSAARDAAGHLENLVADSEPKTETDPVDHE
jgi:hypothetical protein